MKSDGTAWLPHVGIGLLRCQCPNLEIHFKIKISLIFLF